MGQKEGGGAPIEGQGYLYHAFRWVDVRSIETLSQLRAETRRSREDRSGASGDGILKSVIVTKRLVSKSDLVRKGIVAPI